MNAGVWLIDVASGERTVLYDGAAAPATADFADEGMEVHVDLRSSVLRLALDGMLLEEVSGTGLVDWRDGTSRFYRTPEPDGDGFRWVIEHRGTPVELPFEEPFTPLNFNPQSGDLVVETFPDFGPGTIGSTVLYHLIDLDTLTVTEMLSDRTIAVAPAPPRGSRVRWSPSGRFFLRNGRDSRIVYDTETGRTFDPISVRTSERRWARAADSLLVRSPADQLEILHFPDLTRTSITVPADVSFAIFDESGRYVVHRESDREGTVVVDIESGAEVGRWSFPSSFDAVTWTESGPAVFTDLGLTRPESAAEAASCSGVLVFHPLISVDGRCIGVPGFIAIDPLRGLPEFPVAARWSPDASTLSYLDGNALYAHDIARNESRLLAEGVGANPLVRWSPDGKYLLVWWPWLPALL